MCLLCACVYVCVHACMRMRARTCVCCDVCLQNGSWAKWTCQCQKVLFWPLVKYSYKMLLVHLCVYDVRVSCRYETSVLECDDDVKLIKWDSSV